jgi:hypothetical protein
MCVNCADGVLEAVADEDIAAMLQAIGYNAPSGCCGGKCCSSNEAEEVQAEGNNLQDQSDDYTSVPGKPAFTLKASTTEVAARPAVRVNRKVDPLDVSQLDQMLAGVKRDVEELIRRNDLHQMTAHESVTRIARLFQYVVELVRRLRDDKVNNETETA